MLDQHLALNTTVGVALFGCEESRIATNNALLQIVCTFIDTHSKYTTCIVRSLRRSSCCCWSAVDCDRRATVVEVGWRRCCLEDCRECLLFTGARSMGRAVQWSPMKPEAWSGCFPLKSSLTCSYRWLHCNFQNVPRKHSHCTARTQLVNWSVFHV
jgi:hypothetical protein